MSLWRKFVTFAAVVGVTVIGGGFATAAETGTQTVTYSINTTRSITVAADTIAFGANTTSQSEAIAAGTATNAITWSTNSASDKITVQVDALTTGVNLNVKADNIDDGEPGCTGGGRSPGTLAAGNDLYVNDIETESNFVTGIVDCASGTEANIDTLTYQLVSSSALGVGAQSKTVTYTIKAT